MDWFKQFCGIKMSSNYQTFDLISRVLDANKQCRRLVEIGTFTGSLSIYLGLEGIRLGIPVNTMDIKEQHSLTTQIIFTALGVHFTEVDVFKERDKICDGFTEPLFLLCDGGSKKDEFAMCVPHLKSDSIVLVHDYGTEFLSKDWEVYTHIAEPIMQEEWTKEDVRMAVFKIK